MSNIVKKKFNLFDVLNVIFQITFSISIIYPFLYLISLSFSTADALFSSDGMLFLGPRGFTLEAYTKFLSAEFVVQGYMNTLFRTIVGTALSIVFMGLAAYPLSKKKFFFVKGFTIFFVFTIFFNGGLIPLYLLLRDLKLVDNRWVFVLPFIFNSFYMLIIRNFFIGIPEALEESAKIDGANDVMILFKIILPLSLPVLATIGLWVAVFHWNAWFDSMIYISSPEKHVINIHVRRLIIEQNALMMDSMMDSISNYKNASKDVPTGETMKAAAIIVTTVPILVVYPFIQKYFVKGVTVGAVKG